MKATLSPFPVFVVLMLAICSFPVSARDYESPDSYYRPITKKDLYYRQLPKIDGQGKNRIYTPRSHVFDGACPEEIVIGGVGGRDNSIFGNVDINVNVGQDIIINCR